MRACAIPALVMALSSCSLFEASESQTYVLDNVDGHVLPATLISATTVNGDLYEFQVVRGRLTLMGAGRMKKEHDVRNVWNGVPSDTVDSGRWSGTYQETETTVTVQFRDSQGLLHSFTYQVLEGGQVLKGLEGEFAPRLYQYARQ